MSENLTKLAIESVPNQERANELMGKLFDITKPEAVFSQPVTKDAYTVITASELTAGLGFGYGGGGGGSGEAAPEKPESGVGFGGGGGGGGGTMARPVAAIIIGPDGVRVEPIVDATKIAIAFFTAFGAMWVAFGRMRRAASTGKLE